ncbi:MAG TPA: Na+/H+ antiporter [Longimicrobium sp.]|nr:Na+/H+ antiporter [Longimicrobium sp.]
MHLESSFVLLFVAATTVALLTRRWGIPYTVALVLAGLLLGGIHAFQPPHLTRELLFSVFLPGLLFEAAFHLEFREFWRNRVAITSLAVPGVVVSIAAITLVLAPVAALVGARDVFNWRDAMVFGAVITATDPIAVVALFKQLGVPHRLASLIEGESLLNDGTSVVFFTLVLGLVMGEPVSAARLALEFLQVVGIGALIGAGIGLVVSHVIERVDDAMIEITLTTIAAYGTFVLAEGLGYSGVIATVVAGMLCGNYAARVGMSPSTRIAVETFWEYVAFALNSIVFLLIGFEVRLGSLVSHVPGILLAYLATMVARAVVVYGVTAALRGRGDRMPPAWSAVLTWGGLRGGLSMVLVLSLPPAFPHREVIVTLTFGVVLLSILVNGLSMSPLLRRLGVGTAHETRTAYDQARARLQIANAALAELERMVITAQAPPDVIDELRARYNARQEEARSVLRQMQGDQEELRGQEMARARRHLLLLEKERLIRTQREGLIGHDAYAEVMAEIDAQLLNEDTRE